MDFHYADYSQSCRLNFHQHEAPSFALQPSLLPKSSLLASPRSRHSLTQPPLPVPCSSVAPLGQLQDWGLGLTEGSTEENNEGQERRGRKEH